MTEKPQEPPSPIPNQALDEAMMLVPNLREQADKRINGAAANIVTMMMIEMFKVGYLAALRDNGLLPQSEG